MKITYDKTADAAYIYIKRADTKIDSTKQEKDWMLVDYAKNGEIAGIEILNASKKLNLEPLQKIKAFA